MHIKKGKLLSLSLFNHSPSFFFSPQFDELWFTAWSYNQASRFQDSTAILNKAVDVVKAQDESRLPLPMVECVGLCLYLKMSNFNGMDQLNDASESLQKLLKIQNEVVDELWVVPVC